MFIWMVYLIYWKLKLIGMFGYILKFFNNYMYIYMVRFKIINYVINWI